MDFLALHYYGECTGEAFDSYIKGWADAYRMPIWVTEFSCYKGTTDDNMKFMQEALPSIANAYCDVENTVCGAADAVCDRRKCRLR